MLTQFRQMANKLQKPTSRNFTRLATDYIVRTDFDIEKVSCLKSIYSNRVLQEAAMQTHWAEAYNYGVSTFQLCSIPGSK